MHSVVFPIPFILAAIGPHVDAFAVDAAAFEFSDENRVIRPLKRASAVLEAQLEIAFIDCTVGPSLNAIAMFLSIQPLTVVLGSYAVVGVDSLAGSFIIHPVADIDISVGMNQPTSSVFHVVEPVPFILGSVLPDLYAATVSESF